MSDEIKDVMREAIAKLANFDLEAGKLISREAMTRHVIETLRLDYDLLPAAFWDHVMPKLLKIFGRTAQGDHVTQNDVNKLIKRELKKLVK